MMVIPRDCSSGALSISSYALNFAFFSSDNTEDKQHKA